MVIICSLSVVGVHFNEVSRMVHILVWTCTDLLRNLQMNTRFKKRNILGIIVLILLIGIGITVWYVSEQVGETYSEEVSKTKFANLPYHDAALNEFVSPLKLASDREKTTGGDPGFMRFFKESPYAPKTALPKIQLHKQDFSKTPMPFAVYWFGHSTALLELDGHRILIDPIFENAGPLPGIMNAKLLVPIHLATFDLALHPWNESIQMVSDLADSAKVKLITPVMGQKVVPGVTPTEKWWKK